MNLLHTLIAFFVALGTLVVVHELGHYLVARWCGVKVLRFSVGMGRVIWSRRFGRDQTEWALSVLPLGGYVKMLDAREQPLEDIPEADLKREFTRQSVWRRIAIVAAGPIANFLLAILLFAGLYMHGVPEPVPVLRAATAQTAAYQAGLRAGDRITAINGAPVQVWSEVRWKLMQLVLEKADARIDVERPNPNGSGKLLNSVTLRLGGIDSNELEGDFLAKLGLSLARPPAVLGKIMEGPAKMAGLESGDRITAIDGVPVQDGLAFVEKVRESAGKPLLLQGVRGTAPIEVRVTPESVEEGESGKRIGRIKVEVPLAPEMATVSDGPLTAVAKGAQRTWDTSVMTIKMIGKMIIGQVSLKNITGPITIADYAGQTARVGLVSYLSFLAFISISLGVMNLLPIPVLDGGHLLYYALEILTGRPVSERFGEIAQRAGLGLLMALMLVAAFNDIVRLMFQG
ncbi:MULTISPECIES: RIP metalloprotease RseP [Herbaspirillum]|jgi:regulator of sigma E protease|uniref:RIP metalloprotease RseP n=1 Tax=Herbaspirillum TaxID=963 RepID=UPI002582F9A9|nr:MULTISPECIES: RIP metalloprotease RseP [Herbaspirillum]MCP3655199.1 RIP metalloprotease RseP [Herbaspirillum sp.]MCP3945622.1 RIP metalloprotease RseP [Herbaspirillum sp.]MCP4031938.1 RIP metalloprotease RseP [Herbaspirillum sp.]MCP4558631.1 RIP metalloprotease RseP [Herbaspirillum sp.]MEE1635707.1 RIP metalloprotease RseP [Herbaspirillum huttiense NC40101]